MREQNGRPDFSWQVEWLDCVDSTNAELKRRASNGAASGTVLLAGCQTGGRGRLGRQFASPEGGIYLSVLLRPQTHLRRLTAAAAAAVCRAVRSVCGVSPGVKWRNDLLLNGRKLCGILTELAFSASELDYAVLGIGLNCNTASEAFPPELRQTATSLRAELGHMVSLETLAEAMLRELHEMYLALPGGAQAWMAEYAAACVTVGQRVRILYADQTREAFAEGLDADGGLLVREEDGSLAVIDTGEVSVRGLNGYT